MAKKFTTNKISNLDPFIDENEVLRVGGRVKRSNLNNEYVHPILLSGEGIVTNLTCQVVSSVRWSWWKRLYFEQN